MATTDTNTSSGKFPVEGMVTDLHSFNIDEKKFKYMLNGAVETFDGESYMLQNEPSNILAINLPEGFKIIGHKTIIEQDRVILFIVNPITNESQIGEYHNCSYSDQTDSETTYCAHCEPIYIENPPLETITQTPYCQYRTINSTPCLNFNINFPIDIEYKITDCGLNIYFTDNNNERRYIYFEYEDGFPKGNLKIAERFFIISGYTPDDCHTPIYSNILDCNKIKYHPDYSKPCVIFSEVIGGGNLASGVYQGLVAYSDQLGNPLSEYTPGTQPVPIKTKNITVETNYKTDKSIVFEVDNLDQDTFSYYNFIVAETIDNFTQFKLVGTFPVAQNKVRYTGNELTKILNSGEVLFKRPFYKTAKSVTKANDFLFFAGLSEFSKLNLQPIAPLIKFKWMTAAIKEDTYNNPRNTFFLKSLMRDEVYALGLIFEADNNEVLATIHIPGPSKEYFQSIYNINTDLIINNQDVISNINCDPDLRNKNWQVYNFAQVQNTPHNFTDNCDDIKEWESGDFSYWESTEIYPNVPEVWGDLCGKPILHHKAPDNSISHIHDGKDGGKVFSDNNIVFPMGIKLDDDSLAFALQAAVDQEYITEEQKSRIRSYRIIRGNRASNKSIVAKGLLYDVWDYNKNDKKYYYPNYPYNDLRADRYIANDKLTYEVPDSNPTPYINRFRPSGRYTFHSPDIHFTNPSLNSDLELKLETLEYGKAEGYFNECLIQAKYKFLSTASYVLSLAAGVAAALSSTEEKECTTYTLRADTRVDSTSNGQIPYGNVHSTGGGAPISTNQATGNWSGTGESHGQYNDPYDLPQFKLNLYDSTTGQRVRSGTVEDPMTGGIGAPGGPPGIQADNFKIETIQKNTCTGSQWQELNKPGILSILTGALGFGQKSVQGVIYQISLGLFEMKKVLDLIEALVPNKNYAIQYNSAGKYNNYKSVNNYTGQKRRKIQRAAYLSSDFQTVTDDITSSLTTINFNNWHRETGVYLKIQYNNLNDLLPPPIIEDNSRFLLSEKGGYNDLKKTFTSDISSYYGSVKAYIPDQYGRINSINYLDTSGCSFNINETNPFAFGGDTFINRFAIKRKHSFFNQTAFKLSNQADIRYQDLGNAGFPSYYFNTPGSLMENLASLSNILDIIIPGNIPTLFGVPRNRLDVDTLTTFFYQKGYMYLYSYGIPYFFVESDINTDYRHGQNKFERDYYPDVQDLDFWLQEINVDPKEDNFYAYNSTFSKQAHESFIQLNKDNYKPNLLCKSEFPNTLIYSDQSTTDNNDFDNWLVFKANNFKTFDSSKGLLISADSIENDKVMVRFENSVSVFNAYSTLQTDGNNIQVGTGGIFQTKPQEFSKTDLGYIGTQHKAIVHTDFGHVWVDAQRGQVFNLNSEGIEEISGKFVKNWFKENLPFQLQKDFKNISDSDLDNNNKGIGLHLSFDKRFSRLFITKLDYKVTDSRVKYDDLLHEFFYRNETNEKILIIAGNPQFFCNKSWTRSYNFLSKMWTGFHSFIPNVYIDWIDYTQSHIDSSIWSHNVTNKSYQVYYGTLYPFIIEFDTKSTPAISYLNNLEFGLDAVRYHDQFNRFYNDNIIFNKAIVSTNKQCTGNLILTPRNTDDMSSAGYFPRVGSEGTEIEITNREGIWSFNTFFDCLKSQNSNIPYYLNNCANSDKTINQFAFNYFKDDLSKSVLRGNYFNVRLINDKYSNYHFVNKYEITKSNLSIG